MDPEALARTRRRLGKKIQLSQANFSRLAEAASRWGLTRVDGVLLDLGLSTEQIKDQRRGFSWQTDSPLDMRADPNLKVTAADLVNGLGRGELVKLLRLYGELPGAKPLAEAIIAHRPITTTAELARLVKPSGRRHHPATLVFQALRICVNDEINNLKAVLPQAVCMLVTGGRLAVISFHSLEDRIVKNFMRDNRSLKIVTGPIIGERPHAVLRVAEKL